MHKATAAGAAAAGMAAAAAAMAWAVRGRSSGVFGESVWRGSADRKAIALTFDDGPSPSTPALLDVLARYGARATFFQIGANALRHPDIARQVAAAGHAIGNHSQTHPNFALTRPSFIAREFTMAQETLTAVTGTAPLWLRAPYGVRWFGFRDMQRRLGLTGVMWSIIGLEWKLAAPHIAARVLSRARNGDIVCLHDGRGNLKDPDVQATIDAVRRIVPQLIDKGYHFETVDELLCPQLSCPLNMAETS